MAANFFKLAVLTVLLGFVVAQEPINIVDSFRVPFNLAQDATQYFALSVPHPDNVVYAYVQCTTTDLLSFTDEFNLTARLNNLPTDTQYENRAQVESIVREAFAVKEILIPADFSGNGTWFFSVRNRFTDALDCSILAFANELMTPEPNVLTNVQLLTPAWQFFNVRVPADRILSIIALHARVEFLSYELAFNVQPDRYPLISSPGITPDLFLHQRTEFNEVIIPNSDQEQNYFLSSYVLFNGIPVNVPIDYQLFFNLGQERPLQSLVTFEDDVKSLESDYFLINVDTPGTALFISLDADNFVEPLVAFLQYPTLENHIDLFEEYITPDENVTLTNGTHSFNYRAVIPSAQVQEGEYHLRIFNFLVDQINYAVTYELVDELKLEWNQQITAVLVAGRSNSYLVAVNRNDLMLNIVTESNSDFVIMLQLDSYPTDFDSYEIFAEDSWTDNQGVVRKHLIVRPPQDGRVGTWHILVQHKRDNLDEDLQYNLAVFGSSERPLDEYSLVTGTLPRGGFDYFRMEMPASDLFNWYIAVEGSPNLIGAIFQKDQYPTTMENNQNRLIEREILSEDFALTEILVRSDVMEEGNWFLRLDNPARFNPPPQDPNDNTSAPQSRDYSQYSMRSHYVELIPIEIGAEASRIVLSGHRLAFLRVPVITASSDLTLTISPADVQVIARFGDFPLTLAQSPVSSISVANDVMTVTINTDILNTGNYFFRIQANTLLADVSVRAAFNIPAAPTAVVEPPVTQQAPQAETPHDEDGLTPAAREGLNGIQIALVVIIVVAFVVFVGLVSVIIMQRKAIKRLTGGAGKTNLEYTLLEK
jgi:hypothetical protein